MIIGAIIIGVIQILAVVMYYIAFARYLNKKLKDKDYR